MKTCSDETNRELVRMLRNIVVKQRRYRDIDYSAALLARDLGITPARLSCILRQNFGENYSSLVNRYRIRDAKKYLLDANKAAYTVDDIAVLVGFANRQSFYSAFRRFVGTTPDRWRKDGGEVHVPEDESKQII